jgi:hypothetical protein
MNSVLDGDEHHGANAPISALFHRTWLLQPRRAGGYFDTELASMPTNRK